MRRRPIANTLFVAALIVSGARAGAQEPVSDSSARSLAGIEESLEQIVALLRVQVGNQRAELALRRFDISRRDLGALERDLHDAQSARDRYVQSQDEFEARREMLSAEQLAESNMNEEQLEYMRRQIEIETESIKQNLWRTDQRILDLEQEIRRIREDLETWEAMVTESLTQP